ncbi:MAG: tetratricopeptide repeat protein, partial [Woeseiaceae bacterium]
MSNAAAANAGGRRADLAASLKAYEAAAEQWRQVGERRERAQALYSGAMLKYLFAGEWHAADQLAAEAASLYAEVDQPALQANAVLLQAMALTEALNEADEKQPILDRVTEYLERSYVAHEKLGSVAQLARIRYFNALSNLNAGHYEEAKKYYGEAARLYARIDDWNGERKILLDRAVIDIDTGNMDDAIRALQVLRRLEDEKNPEPTPAERNFVATVLDQLGAAQSDIGNIDDALDSFSSARNIHDEAGDLHGKSESLRGIAGAYLESGDFNLARDFLRQAEAAAIASNNGRVLGIVQASLGSLAYSQADYTAAATFYAKALDLAPDEGVVRAHRLILLARAWIASGEYEAGRDVANQALESAERSGSPRIAADALHQIGKAYLELEDSSRSIVSLEQALVLYERLQLVDGLADVAHALALSLADLARSSSPDSDARFAILGDALVRSEQSLGHAEGLLGKVSAPELRAHYAATRRGYYQTHIDLLMQRYTHSDPSGDQYLSQALATSERARARMTMDLLNEASVDLQERVNPDIAEQMDRLLNELQALDRQRELILDKGGVDEQVSKKLTGLVDKVALVKNQFDLLQLELRRSSEHYRALTAPATISLEEIRSLLDSESVMLQY